MHECRRRTIDHRPRRSGPTAVLGALAHAACRLDTSREALTLDLAEHHRDPSQAQVDAVRHGLLDTVTDLDEAGSLPPASALVDEALDASDASAVTRWAVRAVPDSVIDRALPTDDVLRRAIARLDVRALLSALDDPDQLGIALTPTLTDAVKQTLTEQLRSLL